jgi:hypothetical protein
MPDQIRIRWISEAVPGKTFADVGGLWSTVNEQVTVAARAGASATTMIDVDTGEDLWDLFRARTRELGVASTACIQGSIDDPEIVAQAGSFDVVHCSGVLYHCPEPLHTVRQLRAITRETLVLGTVTMPEEVSGGADSISVAPGSALFVPALTDSQRTVLGAWLSDVVGDVEVPGVSFPLGADWALDDYSPWWWLFTRDFVSAMLWIAGFEVEAVCGYSGEWEERATFYLAKARRGPRPPQLNATAVTQPPPPAEEILKQVLESRSWKLTAPLRKTAALVRRWKRES